METFSQIHESKCQCYWLDFPQNQHVSLFLIIQLSHAIEMCIVSLSLQQDIIVWSESQSVDYVDYVEIRRGLFHNRWHDNASTTFCMEEEEQEVLKETQYEHNPCLMKKLHGEDLLLGKLEWQLLQTSPLESY